MWAPSGSRHVTELVATVWRCGVVVASVGAVSQQLCLCAWLALLLPVSMGAIALILTLLVSEFMYYRTTWITSHLVVDTSRCV